MHAHIMHDHVMHAHIMHDHVMHAHAVHFMLYVRINSDMSTVAVRNQTGLTAACQYKCLKISITAKVGMSLKINSVMPPTAKG
jgi:hypothetical protein